MQHDMTDPCPECPFRSDIQGYLRRTRVLSIVESLFRGEPFACHKTTVDVEDSEGWADRDATFESQQCAGAEIFLVKQGCSTQLGRIAERLGLAAKLNLEAPVCGSLEELLEIHSRCL